MSVNQHRWLLENEYKIITKKAKGFGATKVDFDHLWHKINFGKNVQVFCIFKPLVCHFSVQSNNQFSNEPNEELANQIKQNIDNAIKFINYLEKNYNNTKES